MSVSKKVILLGRYGVGKTSLVRRFVYQKFISDYQTTIGVNIEKKVVEVEEQEVSMILWDIAGESSVTKIPETYKLGAHGVIYVFDLSRPDTYTGLATEIENLRYLLLNVPIILVGNKKDLLVENELSSILDSLTLKPAYVCSARTGEEVASFFTEIARRML